MREKLRVEIHYHLPPDPAEFAAAARQMAVEMEPGRWAMMVLLAEAIVEEERSETEARALVLG